MDDKTQKSILITLTIVVLGTLATSWLVTNSKKELAEHTDVDLQLPEDISNVELEVEEPDTLGALNFENDESSMILTDLSIGTKFDFSSQEKVQILWRVPVEGEMKQAQFEGIGIKSKIKREEAYKINDYFEENGFNIDQNNIITQQNVEITGYFRNRTLCQVTQELADINPETGRPVNDYDIRVNVTIACTYVAP